jgi:hypothetical protein
MGEEARAAPLQCSHVHGAVEEVPLQEQKRLIVDRNAEYNIYRR